MRLTLPLHRQVLEIMHDGDAYNPVRVHHYLEEDYGVERRREYIAQEMGKLRDFEILDRVDPENSGLYRITRLGYLTLERMHERDDPDAEFSYRALIAELEEREDEEGGDVSELRGEWAESV